MRSYLGSFAALVLSALLFAACSTDLAGDAPASPSPTAALDPDVAPVTDGDWYRPAADVTWQWQIQGEVNTSYEVAVYDVDLFDVPDAVIRTLQSRGIRVICYFSAGSGENYRPDYDLFAPADLGTPLEGYPNERWLDVRSAQVVAVMEARLDLAARRGCDGVEPDNVTAFDHATGFDITDRDQLAFNRHLANEAHRRGLAIALKNDGDQAEALVDYFDFELNEECHEYAECNLLQVFPKHGKPILNAEYADTRALAEARKSSLCAEAREQQTRTLLLPYDLDDAFRIGCD